MKRYIYIIQSENITNQINREIIAIEKELIINNKKINSENKFSAIVKNNKTIGISYYTEIYFNNLKELKESLNKIVSEKKLSLKYQYKGKKFIIIPIKNNSGVFKKNSLIIHQILNNLNFENLEEYYIGKNNFIPENYNFEFQKYYKDWKFNLDKLILTNSYSYSLLLSFILTYNKYLNSNLNYWNCEKIFHLKITEENLIETLGITKCFLSQFEFYIAPTFYGLIPSNPFYSSLTGEQLMRAFSFFIPDFLKYLAD